MVGVLRKDEWLTNRILDLTFIRITEDLSNAKDKVYFLVKFWQL